MTEWISVETRLPKRGDQVLVAHRRYEWSNSLHKYRKLKRLGVRPATYWLKGHAGLQFCCPGGDVVKEPVAWMPLPEPPEVQRNLSTPTGGAGTTRNSPG